MYIGKYLRVEVLLTNECILLKIVELFFSINTETKDIHFMYFIKKNIYTENFSWLKTAHVMTQ